MWFWLRDPVIHGSEGSRGWRGLGTIVVVPPPIPFGFCPLLFRSKCSHSCACSGVNEVGTSSSIGTPSTDGANSSDERRIALLAIGPIPPLSWVGVGSDPDSLGLEPDESSFVLEKKGVSKGKSKLRSRESPINNLIEERQFSLGELTFKLIKEGIFMIHVAIEPFGSTGGLLPKVLGMLIHKGSLATAGRTMK